MNSVANISTAHTIVPRHAAAILDNLIAIALGALAAKSVSEEFLVAQIVCLVVVFLGYYFAFEAAISRTPGKVLTGLVVVQDDGTRISVRAAAIRTAFRILEVNPVLFGATPAALSILYSRRHQRFGDKVAGTIVVRKPPTGPSS